MLTEITAAAEAVIGTGHFRGLNIALRPGDAREGWDREMVHDILTAARQPPPTPARALEPPPDSGPCGAPDGT